MRRNAILLIARPCSALAFSRKNGLEKLFRTISRRQSTTQFHWKWQKSKAREEKILRTESSVKERRRNTKDKRKSRLFLVDFCGITEEIQ